MGSLHVVPHPKGWAVRVTGGKRALRVYKDRYTAIQFAVYLQHMGGLSVYIHNSDGSVNCKLGVEV